MMTKRTRRKKTTTTNCCVDDSTRNEGWISYNLALNSCVFNILSVNRLTAP